MTNWRSSSGRGVPPSSLPPVRTSPGPEAPSPSARYSSSLMPVSSPASPCSSSSSSCCWSLERSNCGTCAGFMIWRRVGRCGSIPLSVERALSQEPSMLSTASGAGLPEVCGEIELRLKRPPWFKAVSCAGSGSGPSGSRREAWNVLSGAPATILGGPPQASSGGTCGTGGGRAPAPACSARTFSFATFCFHRCSRRTASSSSKCNLSTRSFSTRFSRCISHAWIPSSARVVGSLECGPAQ
mmetsp:Transcript_91657/g.213151  ORF Transcript_91657/g.213151 Transcript_91657/m.213151 type:complete len:241 (+) Transcript_91657:154-876(+)